MTATLATNPVPRPLPRGTGDRLYQGIAWLAALTVLLILGAIIIMLAFGAAPALNKFGFFGFLTSSEWNPVTDMFGALSPIVGTLVSSTIAIAIGFPVSFGIALFITEMAPVWLKRPVGTAIELLAAIPSIIYGMWGLFVFAPFFAAQIQPGLTATLGRLPLVGALFQGPPLGISVFTAGIILAVMIIPFIAATMRDIFATVPRELRESAYGIGCTTWEVVWRVIVPVTRTGIVGSVMLGLGRALGETMAVTFVIGNSHALQAALFAPGNSIASTIANEFTEADSKIYTSSLIALGLILFILTFIVLALAKLMLIWMGVVAKNGKVPRSCHLPPGGYAGQRPPRPTGGRFRAPLGTGAALIVWEPRLSRWGRRFMQQRPAHGARTREQVLMHLIPLGIYARRKAVNAINLTAALLVTLLGLFFLGWLLWTLVDRGFGDLNWALFSQDMPGPGSAGGGLRNAIIGSLMITGVAVLIGAPLGVLAGTYLSEFGRHTLLSHAVRFINDVLLSAPSIVIGVFVYEVMVVPMGGFSGWSGAVALAIIVVPVVVRTTENMMRLVPDTLREAAAALGAPRWKVVNSIVLRAALGGVMTGILLAVARIAGETAPLLFTALGNQFFSTDMSAPMANLPVTIFNFAMGPYQNWHDLAWAGSLLITLAVLILNIATRILLRTRNR